MKRLCHAFLCAVVSILVFSGQPAKAQTIIRETPINFGISGGASGNSSIQTGFAVVTPVETGGAAGLTVSELFSQQVGDQVFRSSVLPSPLVTLTSVLINSNPDLALNTGIAIVNPNVGPAVIRLTLNNNQGVFVAETVFAINGSQQISRFITELFPDTFALTQPFTGLLFITADIPVGILALAFDGPAFTALPVPTQLLSTNVAINGAGTTTSTTVPTGSVNAFAAGTVNGVPTASVNAVPSSTIGAPTGFNLQPPNGPFTVLAAPPFIPTQPMPLPTGAPLPITLPTPLTTPIQSVGSLSPPTPTIQPITGFSAPLVNSTGLTTTAATSTTIVAAPATVTPLPELTLGVGGRLALLLPQVATGGGWESTIAIANTSPTPQVVRVDFFTSLGGPLLLPSGNSFVTVLVPAGGVVSVSTN
jgi:hypothetical protein